MSKISLCSYVDPGVTILPNTFLDEYMLKANGEFLKVYLYLFRWHLDPAKEISVSSIADTFNLTESDVKRALRYWKEEGLIKISGINSKDSLSITLNAIPVKECTHQEEMVSEDFSEDIPAKKPAPSSEDMDYRQLCLIVESYLGKPLTRANIDTISYLYNDLKFSADLIDFLFEYCLSGNHRQMKYIEKVAIKWDEQGIDTVAKAKASIKSFDVKYRSVLKSMGTNNHTPTEGEMEFIDRWCDTLGLSIEVICEACQRAVLHKGSASFPYVDAVLGGWSASGVKTMEDLAVMDEKRKASSSQNRKQTSNSFNSFPQRNYDYEELDRFFINKRTKVSTLG